MFKNGDETKTAPTSFSSLLVDLRKIQGERPNSQFYNDHNKYCELMDGGFIKKVAF